MKVICEYCGKWVNKAAGHVNRANKLNAPLYCNKECAGKARRHNKSKEQLKVEKAAYDVKYRQKNLEWKRFLAAFNFTWDYQAHPEKYRRWRKNRQQYQNEFCRQPEYKKWKKGYDQKYRCEKKYGEFGEAAQILIELEGMIDRDRARFDKGCHNKNQQRKRLWKSLQRSISKTPSGTHSKGSNQEKSNTRTRMQSPAKPVKSSERPTRRLK